MSTYESILDELAAWGSRTTEPADTFQRYNMDETAPSPLKVPLDIRLAPAAPPQRLEQPSRLQTLDHSSALDRRVGRHLYIIRTAGSSPSRSANADMPGAGRARWRSWRPCMTPGVVGIGVNGPSRDAPDREP